MTDEQIIKALECCPKAEMTVDCKALGCPVYQKKGCGYVLNCDLDSTTDAIIEGLSKDALDLINRQQAEIERLNSLKSFESFIDERIHTDKVRGVSWEFATKEDREKAFEKELEKLFDIATARAEAIKEFAERLKANTVTLKVGKQNCRVITVDGIDYFKKEMVGDAE